MTRKNFWTGMLAITLVFGILVVACADSGGTFTLTNIPSRYNGMYMVIWCGDYRLLGAENARIPQAHHVRATASRISNGRASLSMWDVAGNTVTRYFGNQIVDISAAILHSDTFTWADRYIGSGVDFDAVIFSNGSARRSWNDGIEW